MNSIEIVVNTFEDYKKYEQWLFGCKFFEEVDINIFCIQNTNSYFYTTEKVGDSWLVVTNGEYESGENYNE